MAQTPCLHAENRFRQHLKNQSNDAFYASHADLLVFDNGEGWAERAGNRTVTKSEFIQYGKTLLEKNNAPDKSEEAALIAAADELIRILDGKGHQFARYYLRHVLENEPARAVMKREGGKYYTPYFPKSMAFKMHTPHPNLPPCAQWKGFEADAQGIFTFYTHVESLSTPKTEEGKSFVGSCIVVTEIVNPQAQISEGKEIPYERLHRYCSNDPKEGCLTEEHRQQETMSKLSMWEKVMRTNYNYGYASFNVAPPEDMMAGGLFLVAEYYSLGDKPYFN